ncbi:MAG: S8 family serine peptidase, partial [Armatimonadota bacterium]
KFPDITSLSSVLKNDSGTYSLTKSISPKNLVQEQPYDIDAYGNAIVGWQGTSMSTPHVAAAAALLMSMGTPSYAVQDILQKSATPMGSSIPNIYSGYGLLNISKALKTSALGIDIKNPIQGATYYTSKMRHRIDFWNVDPDSINITIDGDAAAENGVPGPKITDWKYVKSPNVGYTLTFTYVVNRSIRNHLLTVKASAPTVNPGDPARTSQVSVSYLLAAKTLTKGWNLFSIPFWYETAKTPEEALNTDAATLFRWTYADNASGQYAKYVLGSNGSPKDAEATFAPPSIYTNGGILMPLGTGTVTAPAGLGYWLNVNADNGIPTPDTSGTFVETNPYSIQLNYGWNLIGDPFTFSVLWSNIIFEYNGKRLTAPEAVASGWINDAVFGWDKELNGATGQYVRSNTATAVMLPWQAQWIKVRVKGSDSWPFPDMKLIIPPTPYTGMIP